VAAPQSKVMLGISLALLVLRLMKMCADEDVDEDRQSSMEAVFCHTVIFVRNHHK